MVSCDVYLDMQKRSLFWAIGTNDRCPSPSNPVVGGEGLAVASLSTPPPALCPSPPHSKISSDAVG